MTYKVKEIFYSLQGEGFHSGRPAVFVRFSGCNLWSGLEKDRDTAICRFCDTDFVGTDGDGGGRFSNSFELADAVNAKWPKVSGGAKYVVCTGGEPLLQLDQSLLRAFRGLGFEVAVETNGTIQTDLWFDWVCVSPKARAVLKQRSGNELKLVFPQEEQSPSDFEKLDFDNFYLQPMDGPNHTKNTQLALQYCLEHPKWKLSLQTHKLLNIR